MINIFYSRTQIYLGCPLSTSFETTPPETKAKNSSLKRHSTCSKILDVRSEGRAPLESDPSAERSDGGVAAKKARAKRKLGPCSCYSSEDE